MSANIAPPASQPQNASLVASVSAVEPVDIAGILDQEVTGSGQTLNWRPSIVDLVKLCGIDSSLENRRTLAHELGYTGGTEDSASMKIWLYKQVLRKLEESGGVVPADLKD